MYLPVGVGGSAGLIPLSYPVTREADGDSGESPKPVGRPLYPLGIAHLQYTTGDSHGMDRVPPPKKNKS